MRYRICTERSDLFDVNIVITMLVRINKNVPFDKLRDAYVKALSLHEVLNMKIMIDGSGDAFYVDNDDPHSSFTSTDMSLDELISTNERRRFLIERGEFIRGFASPDGLVFMMHHLAGDGKSLLYFIETFMRCLNGEELSAQPFRNLTIQDLPAKNRLSYVYRKLAQIWNRQWMKEKKVFGFDDMDAAYSQFWKDHKTRTEIRSYSKAELEELVKSAKDTGVTVTSYLITCMIRDMYRKADVGIAVDGRLDNNRSMGNQATGISVEYKYNMTKSFEENAKNVQRLMKNKLGNDRSRYLVLHFMGMLDPTLTDALNLEHAGYFRGKVSSKVAGYLGYGDKTKDISLTNLTRADIPEEYGPFRIEGIVFVPPVVSYGKKVTGIVTSGGIMNIATRYYE